MLTLYQHLLALPAHDVRAVATHLALRQRTQRHKQAWVAAIEDAWQTSAYVQLWLARLSPQARAALQRLLQVEQMPAALFLAEYGEIRRAAQRQSWPIPPWQAPATPAEELYYLGLLCPANGQPLPKALYLTLPLDLRPLLNAALGPENQQAAASQPPIPDHTAAHTLCHDVGQLLIYLHQQALNPDHAPLIQHNRWLTAPQLRVLNQSLLEPQGDVLACIEAALAADPKPDLRIAYWAADDDHKLVRRITPYALETRAKILYLTAYCHLREQARVFRVDRIEACETVEGRQ